MRFEWSEAKRRSNLKNHALDFRDPPNVFEGAAFTFEDDRINYGEKRYVTLGLLGGIHVSIVHTETTECIRMISFRKATKHEQEIFFQNI